VLGNKLWFGQCRAAHGCKSCFRQGLRISYLLLIRISPLFSSLASRTIYPSTRSGHSSHSTAPFGLSFVRIDRIAVTSTIRRGKAPKPPQRHVRERQPSLAVHYESGGVNPESWILWTTKSGYRISVTADQSILLLETRETIMLARPLLEAASKKPRIWIASLAKLHQGRRRLTTPAWRVIDENVWSSL